MTSYDESKHTRGGNPANTGEYSEKTNSAPESKLPPAVKKHSELLREAAKGSRQVLADAARAHSYKLSALLHQVIKEHHPNAARAVLFRDWNEISDIYSLNRLEDQNGNEIAVTSEGEAEADQILAELEYDAGDWFDGELDPELEERGEVVGIRLDVPFYHRRS